MCRVHVMGARQASARDVLNVCRTKTGHAEPGSQAPVAISRPARGSRPSQETVGCRPSGAPERRGTNRITVITVPSGMGQPFQIRCHRARLPHHGEQETAVPSDRREPTRDAGRMPRRLGMHVEFRAQERRGQLCDRLLHRVARVIHRPAEAAVKLRRPRG